MEYVTLIIQNLYIVLFGKLLMS